MNQANFYPGPSRVYSNITEFIYEAYMEGVMSINHRSEPFMQLMKDTKAVLREKLMVPEDYEILFTSSATECWEIIAQSLTSSRSQHFYNGAFGDKWVSYAEKLTEVIKTQFGINEELPTGEVQKSDVYCVTQNETSNATQVSMELLRVLREKVNGLIAVDVTSSFGGVSLNYEYGDIWYGSVQKCLGLPAGMGFMIVSPKAVSTAEKIGDNNRYNSLLRLIENARKNQTSYTPNVLNIYLLYRTQQVSKGLAHNEAKLRKRYQEYIELIGDIPEMDVMIKNEAVRSTTVLAIDTKDPGKIKADALERGIVLGNGYGLWKSSTFRIANFPAIKTREVEKLHAFLARYR